MYLYDKERERLGGAFSNLSLLSEINIFMFEHHNYIQSVMYYYIN